MDAKGYLYMFCAIGTFFGGRAMADRGDRAGPGSLIVFLVPFVGLIVLLSLDVMAYLRTQSRPRPARRRKRRRDWDDD